MSDLGNNPMLSVSLYSKTEDKIVDVDASIDIKEVRQLSNKTLFVGTIYINKMRNTLPVGDYYILLTVRLPYRNENLLYVPIELRENENPIEVSWLHRKNLTEHEVRSYLKDLIAPGVKRGLQVRAGTQFNRLTINPGVAFSHRGARIEFPDTMHNIVTIDATEEYPRTDVICIYYDEEKYDIDGHAAPPVIRVMKGNPGNPFEPPMLPDNYIQLAYVSVKADTKILKEGNYNIANIRSINYEEPFSHELPEEEADGVRTDFNFKFKFLSGTTSAFVDGVRQFLDKDYEEIDGMMIRFIGGEVPQEGQKVTLSGQRRRQPFINYSMKDYIAANPAVYEIYPRFEDVEPVDYYLGKDYSYTTGTLVSTIIPECSFNSPKHAPSFVPLKGYSNDLKTFLFFDEASRMRFIEDSEITQKNVTYVLVGDWRDMPRTDDKRRLLTLEKFYVTMRANTERLEIELVRRTDDNVLKRLNIPVNIVNNGKTTLMVTLFEDEIGLRFSKTFHVESAPPSGFSWVQYGSASLGAVAVEDETLKGVSYSLSALYVYDQKLGQQEVEDFI